MPFDEEDEQQSQSQKVLLKQVSTQKSIFDSQIKKPSGEDFNKQVKNFQKQYDSYKEQAAELSLKFQKTIIDKTLKENKTIFNREIEQELLSDMISLAIKINNDHNLEEEGIGSINWIILLLKTCFNQRDRLNSLEYNFSQLEKKLKIALDKIKSNE